MRFGRQLKNSVYQPWADKYIDYDKLKKLLREPASVPGSPVEEEDDEWTEEDEGAFVEELVNVQLEKVAAFESETLKRLQDETAECEKELEPLGVGLSENKSGDHLAVEETAKPQPPDEERRQILEGALRKLDNITKETNELEKFGRINYTGFLKAGKKHDRKRGQAYRVRPLLQVRLSALPFYKEDYSPLLYRLSAMYSFVRQSLDGKDHRGLSFSDSQAGADSYVSYKFWVHPENVLEVKTVILRRLPVLVYNPQTSKIADGTEPDPTITSIYFDNPAFSLYTKKVGHEPDAPSLRLRWFGDLQGKTEILFEKKVIKEGNVSEEERFTIRDKYVRAFIKGEYKMEKSVAKLKDRSGEDSSRVEQFQKAVDDIQAFIQESKLQPVVRANYSRTAFEIPGDDRIRISLDTNLAFIREDAIDTERPCRDPEEWHRKDIDDAHMEYPFNRVRKGEINRFPFAVLEIKVRGPKRYEWVDDLMNSHLVKEAPRFSKFVHGISTLFEDYVNTFPFWLSQVDMDIRRDPQEAFEEEQERKAKMAEDDFVVGSLFGPKASPARPPFRGSFASPPGSSTVKPSGSNQVSTSPKATPDMTRVVVDKKAAKDYQVEEEGSDDDDDGGVQAQREPESTVAGLSQLFPAFSMSKYARARRGGRVKLPPGVQKPTFWIKDQGPVKVEPKVWLANQRTFIKWQHVSILLAALALGLYNAAGDDNPIGRTLGVVYTVFGLFAGMWGWGVYVYRSHLIRQRSGKDFDVRFGPVVICLGLMFALLANFGLKYHKVMLEQDRQRNGNQTELYRIPHSGEL